MKITAPADRMPLVGILFPFEDTNWLGGSYAIKHLLRAHSRLKSPKIRLALITPPTLPQTIEGDLPDVVRLPTSFLKSGSVSGLIRSIVRKLTKRDILFSHWLQRNGVSALSHADPLGPQSPIPVIGHIPDLSVHHYPDQYDEPAAQGLKEYIRRHVDGVDTVLLLSEAVEKDFEIFYGKTSGVRKVVHVVPSVPERMPELEEVVRKKYQLPPRFFYLPNKFWRHKNHRVVIEALGRLRSQNTSVTVVCSGMEYDERQPSHFSDLMKRVDELGLEDQFKSLGIVPGEDVMALMRASIAVLNPSEFEGWGLSVAEAREMGKHVVVSDIDVFREHRPARSSFFRPQDAASLASILRDLHDRFDALEEDREQEAAAAKHDSHLQQYALQFEAVVLETLTKRRLK